MLTKVITAHLPSELAAKVDRIAADLERSRGWVVKEALSAWVAQEEERRRWTREALADVDAARVIAHDDVLAWANSLEGETPLAVPAPQARIASRKPVRTKRKR